jgi:predicted membrane-bound mannosyltransferase
MPVAARPARQGPTVEIILYAVLLLLAITTRFALLGAMALHHDEGIHARFGWDIYQGIGWTHDAVYHGPVIYHAEALGFYLFGDSDATTRVTFAITSVITVMLPFLLRRQLGRWGALLASFLFLISPSFLYFGRFGHPDVFGSFFTLLCFVCIVRYIADRKNVWLYGAVVATCLHFSSKPTAYIVTAIFLVYLAGRLLWERYDLWAFLPMVGLAPAVIETLWKTLSKGAFLLPPAFPPATPAAGTAVTTTTGVLGGLSWLSLPFLALALLAILGMLAWRWYEGWSKKAPPSASLDLIVALGTMVLPLLSAILLNELIRLRGLEPLDYHLPDIAPEVVVLAVVAIGTMFLLSAAIGVPWDWRRWLVSAGLFWSIFFVLHTSFFSSMTGWATGLVQALGFWLTQQDVKRIYVGPQYYLMLMSAYETVAFFFGWVGAAYFALKGLLGSSTRSRPQPAAAPEAALPGDNPAVPLRASSNVATGMLAFWAPAAFLMFSFAGEQVPWLNLHPTLPFILVTAAFVGRIVAFRPRHAPRETLRLWADRVLLAAAALLLLWAGRPLFVELFTPHPAVPGSAWWANPTFQAIAWAAAWVVSTVILVALAYVAVTSQGKRLGESHLMVLAAVAMVMAGIGASVLSFGKTYDQWPALYIPLALVLVAALVRVVLLGKTALRAVALVVFAALCVYGLGSAIRLTYINNDTPVEMLVYVQSGSDVQWAMDSMGALSTLTTGGKDMALLYDSDVAWPFEWYLRNYPKKVYQATISGPPPQEAAVAFVYRDKDNTSAPYLDSRYDAVRYYIFNWWFPEDTYRSARTFVDRIAPELLQGEVETGHVQEVGLLDVARAILSSPGQARIWRWYLYREILSPLGAREFAFYVRRDLVAPLELLQDTLPRR